MHALSCLVKCYKHVGAGYCHHIQTQDVPFNSFFVAYSITHIDQMSKPLSYSSMPCINGQICN
jgi:hypothetical protein